MLKSLLEKWNKKVLYWPLKSEHTEPPLDEAGNEGIEKARREEREEGNRTIDGR